VKPSAAARFALTAALIPLGFAAFRDEYGYVPLIGDINTAVHEFGHLLFMPFGETMMFLGGSLTQVVFPLVFAAYFFFKRERPDPHAATVCLWWSALNVLSVAIYVGDARARELMLLTGATGQDDDSGHDFYNLFSRWGVLQHDTIYASGLRNLAWMMFAISVVGGFLAAWRGARETSSSDQKTAHHG
jgi:hypothetical protein